MTEGNPVILIISFAIPVFLGYFFQELYVIVDTIVISHGVGIQALAALGLTGWMTWLMTGAIVGLGQGITVVVARYFGENDQTMLRRTVAMSFAVSFGETIIITALFETLLIPALSVLHATNEIIPYAEVYCRIFYAGAFAAMFYNTQAAILRGVGDSKTPLKAILISSAINIILDILFVFGFGWGIAGAGIATVMANIISGIYCLHVLKRYDFLIPEKSDYILDLNLIKEIVFLGFPIIFENIIIAVGGLIVQSVIDLYGTAFIAGFAATNRIYMFITIVANSIAAATAVFVGQNYGSGLMERIHSTVVKIGIISVACAVVISSILYYFGEMIIGVFVTKGASEAVDTINFGYSYLLSYVWFLWIIYLGQLFRYALQGLGRTSFIMLSGFAGFFGRAGIALLLPTYLGYKILFFDEVISSMGELIVLASAYFFVIKKNITNYKEEKK